MFEKVIIHLINEFWILLEEVSPWLLLGFFISGVLKILLFENKISYHLNKSKFSSVIKASLFGIPLPLCSCGVLPVATSLHRNGASKGAVASFLISTPQTGIDSIAFTYGILGLPFTVIRILVALISAIFGGVIMNFFMPSHIIIENNKKLNKKYNSIQYQNKFSKKIFQIFHYGFIEILRDLSKWILLGLTLATFFSIFLPEELIIRSFNSYWKEFLFIILISLPLYVCATGSIPIALVFLSKGISPGSILLFLILGPATNITSIVVLIKSLGKKFTIIYLISLIVSSIFFSIIINKFLSKNWLIPNIKQVNSIYHFNVINVISAIILLILLLNALFFNLFYKKKIIKKEQSKSFLIEGISCNHCKIDIENNISRLQGVKSVLVDLKSKKILVLGDYNESELINCINKLGFKLQVQKLSK